MSAVVFWLASAAGLAVAYLLGAIPSGYLAGRLLRGVDIRDHGSRSTGATNVLRTLGPWPAAGVLLADLLKGAAAILFARAYYAWLAAAQLGPSAWTTWAVSLAGLAVLIGHARSIWLGFTGGKSAATGLGLLLALSWPVGLGAAAVFAVVVALGRRVSPGSILAALTAVALVCLLEEPLPYRLLVIAGGAFVVLRHRANIQRLLAGTEPRLGQGAP